MNPRLKQLFSNTLIFTIANFSSKILSFLMVPLYTAVLTTEEYGVSDMVNTIGGLLLPILSLSISNAVLRFCFIKDYSKEDVFTIAHRLILKGTIASLIITSILYCLYFFPQIGVYIWFVPAYFLFNAYSSFLSYFSQGLGKVKISAIAGVVSTFTIVFLNVLFLLVFKWGVLGYMISFLLGPLASTIYIGYKLSILDYIKPGLNTELQKQMIKFAAPLIPNDLSWWALDSFNRFLILSTVSVAAVGIYSASAKIPAILTAVFGIFSQAWMLSALDGYGSEENKTFICAIHKKLFSLLSVITALFIVLSKPMAVLLLSGEFSSCWNIIPYLMIAVFMGALVGFYGSIYSAERKNTIQFISTMVGGLVSIIMMILFLKSKGIVVAAISNMIGYIVIWFIRKEGIKKFINIGMSTWYCAILVMLLIIEAILISHTMWILSVVIVLSIILINWKELINSLLYFKGLAIELSKRKKLWLK